MNKVTSLADIRRAAEAATAIVELPGWEPNKPVYFKLKRTSARVMVAEGKIPNPLMAAAQRMLEGGAARGGSVPLDKSLQLMDAIVRDAMVEPTFDELRENGIELTDEQYSDIFNFAQAGVTALSRFRKQSGDVDADRDGEDVVDKAE